MGITFNADEIFEMAEQIERNGAKFYRKAARGISDKVAGQMLIELAAMEDDHEKTFAEMRDQLSDKERQQMVFDPDSQASLYLRVIADGHVFDVKKDPSAQLSGNETTAAILKMAIGAETDSIAFYVGLKEFVPAKAAKDKVDAIIKEEIGHIVTLSEKLPGPE